MKKKVFINGPMTGLPNGNAAEFEKAEKYYENLGYEVEQPHNIYKACFETAVEFGDDKFTKNIFAWCDLMLSDCDIMVLLPGYKDCDRAKLFISIAVIEYKIPIYKAYSEQVFKLDSHIAIITAYAFLSDSGKITEILEAMPSEKELIPQTV